MTNTPVPYDDEIDLLEFFSTLWKRKALIVGFVSVALLMGLGYLQMATPRYTVSVPYKINVHSVVSQQVCERYNRKAAECMALGTLDIVLNHLGSEWSREKKRDVLTLSTLSPMSLEEYQQGLEDVENEISERVLNEAKAELAIIQDELDDALLGTERVATNLLNAKRVVTAIENGVSVVSFGSPHVAKSSPKTALILIFSVIIGGVFAIFYILIGNAIRQRKEKMTAS